MRAREKLRFDEFERQRVLNYEMANLIAVAFHSPRKMPEYKAISRNKTPENPEINEAKVRAYFIALSKRSEK